MICCLLGSLSACASNPVDIPKWDLVPVEEASQHPIRLPELPSPVSSTEDTVTFSRPDFARLLRYATVSGGNYEIAEANALALESMNEAYNSLIVAGQAQLSFTQIREEQLQQERRDHFIDNWFHRGLIALAILVTL